MSRIQEEKEKYFDNGYHRWYVDGVKRDPQGTHQVTMKYSGDIYLDDVLQAHNITESDRHPYEYVCSEDEYKNLMTHTNRDGDKPVVWVQDGDSPYMKPKLDMTKIARTEIPFSQAELDTNKVKAIMISDTDVSGYFYNEALGKRERNKHDIESLRQDLEKHDSDWVLYDDWKQELDKHRRRQAVYDKTFRVVVADTIPHGDNTMVAFALANDVDVQSKNRITLNQTHAYTGEKGNYLTFTTDNYNKLLEQTNTDGDKPVFDAKLVTYDADHTFVDYESITPSEKAFDLQAHSRNTGRPVKFVHGYLHQETEFGERMISKSKDDALEL